MPCTRRSTKHDDALTDSMKMFKWGVEGGKPKGSKPGVQPEWFYKGNGRNVVGCGSPLPSPDFAEDHGEEPELVGLYIIDDNRRPHRLGFAIGNEFSDHVTERRNYLLLAHSKLRQCGVGPDAQHRHAAGAPGRHEPHPPRWRGAVAEAVPHRRSEHVPHVRQSRIPPLQVQTASRARRRAPALLRHRHRELRRRHRDAGRR